MKTSIFIAKIIGPLFLAIAIGIIFNRNFFRKVLQDCCKNNGLVLFIGMCSFVTSIVVVLLHNIWEANWTVAITILGWLGLIKGILFIVFPTTTVKMLQHFQKSKVLLAIRLIIISILGITLTAFAYFL
jgi:hypothetical protein